jgi:hypothetical protein
MKVALLGEKRHEEEGAIATTLSTYTPPLDVKTKVPPFLDPAQTLFAASSTAAG